MSAIFVLLVLMGLMFLLGGIRDLVIWRHHKRRVAAEWKDQQQWNRFSNYKEKK